MGSATGTTYNLIALTCGTSYTLAVDAFDAAGNHSTQTSAAISTAACATSDIQAPTVPTGLTVGSATQTSVVLSWAASSDNVGVVGYDAFVNGSSAGSPTGTSYTFTGLACGTSYTLAVDAFDAAGNRSGKASLSASTAACPDTDAPSTPTGLAKSGSTPSSVSLSWSASHDNVGVAGYGIYQGASSAGSTASTSYTVAGLSCGTSYSFAVDAYDAVGNRSAKATVSASTSACPDTQPPTTPTALTVATVTQTSVGLSWPASTDNVGVGGYTVYQGASVAGSTASTSYTVAGLSCGTTYTLAVDAYDAAGNRSGKATISVSTAACPDSQAPTTPAGLTVVTATQTSVGLSWAASTDNVGVVGYGLYLSGVPVGSTGSRSYTFGGLSCGTSYAIAVDAVDAAGNRSGQATITVSSAACSSDTQAPTNPTGLTVVAATQTSVALTWSASSDNVGVAGYGVYQGATIAGSTSSTSYTISGLSCGTSYGLSVDAFDTAGNRSGRASADCASTAACSDTQAPTRADRSDCWECDADLGCAFLGGVER